MANLTNKCTNADIDYWISEAANIIGLKDKVNTNNPKEVLVYMMKNVINFKFATH